MLADLTVSVMGPVGAEMRRLLGDPAEIDRILSAGAEHARSLAAPILAETKKLVVSGAAELGSGRMTQRRKFLVVADESAEFPVGAPLRLPPRPLHRRLCGAAEGDEPASRSSNGSGVREEIARQQRQRPRPRCSSTAEYVLAESGAAAGVPDQGSRIRCERPLMAVLSEDTGHKIMVLPAAVGGRGPGPLVASIAKEGVKWGARKVPITIVPGDLTSREIAELA
jgi:hypothetical protein